MKKTESSRDAWRHWLSFSAFTLAGIALEGSAPSLMEPMRREAAKARKWRAKP